ncbi:uncharacterized protein BJ171DRAFT_493543 [Polychytrium aggregatum]|uniref:uncharacterized protein n=1 Tax=Polychytrium aggregatum TaxID=110093 RepID=UPI0022FF0BDA|nr:uncharacterized protein BJ171DRAFT_493543 [Polychytrium aggregatum]KAI9207694.1 hypothetical protein BJ171DRAFT_493543 [Polychytrium aggregatum]
MAEAAEEEEEDFMSDKFIERILVSESADRRKSSQRSYTQIRKAKEAKQRVAERASSQKHQDQERQRQISLSTAIDESNKGFQLLAKMGYRKGEGLGKSPDASITEPIKVDIKANREGLGLSTLKREREKELVELGVQASKRLHHDFESTQRQRFAEQQLARDLHKSRRCCEQLDLDSGIEHSDYWIAQSSGDRDDDDTAAEHVPSPFEQLEPAEQLRIVTRHLREQHRYCIWCGIKFGDEGDMAQNCPGDCRAVHDDT